MDRNGDRSSSDANSSGRYLAISWPHLALGLTVITATALGTLAVVTTVNDIDVLSTVALALAVLSFVAQLIISISQGQAANQQLLQSERVNTETQALLADVRATSQGLLSTFREQFDMVLRHLLRQLPQAIEEASEEGGTSEDIERKIAENMQTAVENYMESIRTSLPPSVRTTVHGPSVELDGATRRTIRRLQTYPDEQEGRKALEYLSELTPLETNTLIRRAHGEISRMERGAPRGVFINDDSAGNQALLRKGFQEVVDPPPDRISEGRPFVELTDKGREAARLLIGQGPAPDWLKREIRSDK
jgi:hypothetical protein